MANLEIIINARDNASRALGGIGSNLQQLGKWGAIGAAGLATGLAGATAGLLALGSSAEEMQGKFNKVFGDFAPQTEAALGAFADVVGRNQFELMGFASTLQDTFVPLGFSREAAAGLSTELVKLAVDLGSFNNVSEESVVSDLQSALTGQADVMKKYGIVINEAAIKQEALRAGLVGAGEEMTNTAKAQATLNLIMAGSADAIGDATTTAGSFANQMRGVTAGLTEAATAAGVQLLPVFTPMLASLGQIANQMLPLMVTRFTEFATSLGTTLGPAGLLIEDAFTRIGFALGQTSEKVTTADVFMAAFGGTLDAIIIGVQAFAIGMQGLAFVIESVSSAVTIATGLWDQFNTIMASDAITPGVVAIKALASGLLSVGSGITSVIGLWQTLASTVASIQIPNILTPGSPTPMELGLRGISDALREMNKVGGPQLKDSSPVGPSKAGPPAPPANPAGNAQPGSFTITVPVYLDGRKIAEVLAPSGAMKKMGGLSSL